MATATRRRKARSSARKAEKAKSKTEPRKITTIAGAMSALFEVFDIPVDTAGRLALIEQRLPDFSADLRPTVQSTIDHAREALKAGDGAGLELMIFFLGMVVCNAIRVAHPEAALAQFHKQQIEPAVNGARKRGDVTRERIERVNAALGPRKQDESRRARGLRIRQHWSKHFDSAVRCPSLRSILTYV